MPSDWGDLLEAVAGARLKNVRPLSPAELALPWARNRRIVDALVGEMRIDDHDVTVRIAIGDRFPYELPHVFVLNGASLPFLPHIDRSGWVCFRASEGLVLRTSAPEHLLADAFALAYETIEQGLRGLNASDVFDELEAYWVERANATVPSFIEPDERIHDVTIGFENLRFHYVAESFDHVRRWSTKITRTREYRGLYIPISRSVTSENVVPDSFANASWVKNLVFRHLPERTAARLRRRLDAREHWPFLVLGVPRARTQDRSLVGVHFTQVRDGHPLTTGITNQPARFVALERHDHSFLLARSGGRMSLATARIAMVGLGAVGGYATMALAAAGVRSFVLIDPERLSRENVYRHTLGRSALGSHKVEAMKRELDTKYPYLDVKILRERAEDAKTDWTSYDIVVVTTGDINSSRALNRRFAEEQVATVFSWLEPLGIGGHALLTHLSATRGCYECLFRMPNGEESLYNAADFAAPGQTFARDLAGCTTLFTPFAALDAIRTAEVCVRLVVAALADKERAHPLNSWRGDPTEFLARRLTLSPRYEQSDVAMSAARHQYSVPNCPVCGTVDR